MANPSATATASASTSRASCASPSTGKLTCLCSPTNHPGSFRCTRHRNPRGRPESSPSGRASHQSAASCASATVRAEGVIRSGGVGAGGRTAKGRSVLRAHLLRLVSAPSSAGRDHRRCRDFMPRPSRLGRLAVTA